MGYYTHLLNETAVLKTVNGYDCESRPNIIALDEIDCKIEFQNSATKNKLGEDVTSSGRLYTESTIKIDDIIEIKDKEFRVVSVKPYYPIDNNILTINEVYFA